MNTDVVATSTRKLADNYLISYNKYLSLAINHLDNYLAKTN